MRTIFEMSIDSQTILKRLSEAEIGEVISYSDMNKLIGRSVQAEAHYCLQTAMRNMLSDGKVFAVVRGEGVRRLADAEIVGVGEYALAHMRRTARRAGRKLLAVEDFDALPNEIKIRHNAIASVLGAIEHFSHPLRVKRIEGKVAQAQARLPLKKTLEAFTE